MARYALPMFLRAISKTPPSTPLNGLARSSLRPSAAIVIARSMRSCTSLGNASNSFRAAFSHETGRVSRIQENLTNLSTDVKQSLELYLYTCILTYKERQAYIRFSWRDFRPRVSAPPLTRSLVRTSAAIVIARSMRSCTSLGYVSILSARLLATKPGVYLAFVEFDKFVNRRQTISRTLFVYMYTYL